MLCVISRFLARRAELLGIVGLGCLAGCSSQTPAAQGFPDATTVMTQKPQLDAGSQTPDAAAPLHMSMSMSAKCATSSPDQQGCPCTIGEHVACYTGPAASRNIGMCHDGLETCQAGSEFNSFGSCVGEVLPATQLSCWLAAVDAGAPHDAAPPLDGGPVTFDAGGPAVVGQPCIPGQVQPDPDGGAPLGTNGGEVYYCDTGATWGTFPSANCTAAACEACLRANCVVRDAGAGDAGVPDASGAHCPRFNDGFAWLAQCGPDRSTYWTQLEGSCAELQALVNCKDTSCVTGPFPQGPCSFY
jgi:hypothetical protein